MLREITRADHPIIKQTASLKEKKYRERLGEFLVEGELSVLWALQSAFTITAVIKSADIPLPAALAEPTEAVPIYSVPPHLFAKIADTKTPQGILCTCALPEQPPLPASGHYIYCDRVRDPGNLGSIIRSADALGFDGIMLSEACVDPFSPKLVRSTMGSLFHTRLYTDINTETLKKLQENGFHLAVSALTEDSLVPKNFAVQQNVILAVGNESSGISEKLLALADSVIKIPMAGSAESLNVAAAAAILMYECKARRLS